MLTDHERTLLEAVFTDGPSALIAAGYNEETGRAFLTRPDVASYWRGMTTELNHAEILDARSKFMAKRGANKFRNGAIAVLGRALAGPTYLRDANGAIRTDAKGNPLMADPGPNSVQIKAAESLLEVIGALGGGAGRGKQEGRVEDYNPVTALAPVSTEKLGIEENPSLTSHADKALSRERVRNAMILLAHLVPKGKAGVESALKLTVVKPKGKKPSNDTVSSGT